MKNRKYYSSHTAILDTFMTIALVSLALFYIAFPLINPISKSTTEGIIPKSDFLISLEWNEKSTSDIDIWVKDPTGRVVSFLNKSDNGVFLDKDDIGTNSDIINLADGTAYTIEINREVINIRGFVPGVYTVNAHYYRGYDKDLNLRYELVKMQPFALLFKGESVIHKMGEEVTLIRFEVDVEGIVRKIDRNFEAFVNDNRTTK